MQEMRIKTYKVYRKRIFKDDRNQFFLISSNLKLPVIKYK